MLKVKTVTSLKGCAIKCLTYSQRIRKPLTVQLFSANLVN
jgi:hypothetical protein